MVLLGVMGDDIVKLRDISQLRHQGLRQRGVDRVQESGLGAAFNQVRIVGGAVRKRNQRVEQPPVPIDGPQPMNPLLD